MIIVVVIMVTAMKAWSELTYLWYTTSPLVGSTLNMPEAQHFSCVLVRVEVHMAVPAPRVRLVPRCRAPVRENRERRVVARTDMMTYWRANLRNSVITIGKQTISYLIL